MTVCNCLLAQPISIAYCERCLREGFERYDLMVSLVACLGREGIDDWAREIIDRSLAFHGKTWKDLEIEARQLVLKERT